MFAARDLRGEEGLQCSRRHLQTRFDLRNCNAMCAPCNRRHNEDPEPYLLFMAERYGAEVVAKIEGLRGVTGKVADEELREALERLRALA